MQYVQSWWRPDLQTLLRHWHSAAILMGVVSQHTHYSNNFVLSPLGYVGPRNLPSTGFFPFLQTLMCTTDSNCHNKSHLLNPAASKSHRSSRTARYLYSTVCIARTNSYLSFNISQYECCIKNMHVLNLNWPSIT